MDGKKLPYEEAELRYATMETFAINLRRGFGTKASGEDRLRNFQSTCSRCYLYLNGCAVLISQQYITQPLTKEHDFDLSVAPKPTMTIEDLAIIIHYHWVHDPSIFPTERQRVQFAFIMLLIAYTGSRPGALMNTESGEESKPKGLRYQDFELVLLRDPENPAVHVLIMHAVLHHMKGREGNGKPYVPGRPARWDFTDVTRTSYMFWQRDDSLAFCPITMFLSLAFADGAIDAKTGIHSPADLFSKKVPRGLNALRIPWEPGVEKKPVLLASQVSGCFQACSDRMLRFNSFSSDVRRLGLHAGFPDAVTSYCTRRAVANAVDGEFSTASSRAMH